MACTQRCGGCRLAKARKISTCSFPGEKCFRLLRSGARDAAKNYFFAPAYATILGHAAENYFFAPAYATILGHAAENYFFAPALGLLNRNVIRSDSPIARYFALSTSPSVSVGGSVHTPFG